jgi:hypothetical protein
MDYEISRGTAEDLKSLNSSYSFVLKFFNTCDESTRDAAWIHTQSVLYPLHGLQLIETCKCNLKGERSSYAGQEVTRKRTQKYSIEKVCVITQLLWDIYIQALYISPWSMAGVYMIQRGQSSSHPSVVDDPKYQTFLDPRHLSQGGWKSPRGGVWFWPWPWSGSWLSECIMCPYGSGSG